MSKLIRKSVGEFDISEALTLDKIEENQSNMKFFEDNIIKIEDMFKNCKSITLDDEKLKDFLNGVKLSCNLNDNICKVYDTYDFFIGIAEIKGHKLKRDVII